MASLSKIEAESFFERVLAGVQQGDRILLAAFSDSQVVGTVQILLATPPNQPHRADIAKLLVLRSARGQGVGALLMRRAEEESRLIGKTLLVLDTATGRQGEQLYMRLGWTRAGVIPKYALYPDGTWCDTTIFWKQLSYTRDVKIDTAPRCLHMPITSGIHTAVNPLSYAGTDSEPPKSSVSALPRSIVKRANVTHAV